jgi:hypothetical protein
MVQVCLHPLYDQLVRLAGSVVVAGLPLSSLPFEILFVSNSDGP